MIDYLIAFGGVSVIAAFVIYLQIKDRRDTRLHDDEGDAKWLQRWGF